MSRVVLLHALIVACLVAGCRSQPIHHETTYPGTSPTAFADDRESEENELADSLPVPGNPPEREARKEPAKCEPRTWSERHPVAAKVRSHVSSALATTAVLVLSLGVGVLYAMAEGNTSGQSYR